MIESAKKPITIDLNQFKLHMHVKNGIELTLHFNSPSRRFYLSVIAFVVKEMKRLGKILSIPLAEHLDLLVLLNESVGGSAGSSDKENLLPRIYRKWKDALPNLEEAPLFKVLGRKKEYGEGIDKTYSFTESEKDTWANLFEYKGSEENVRLRFAIDKIGASLDDVVITYEELVNAEAWESFISSLKEEGRGKSETEEISEVAEHPASPEFAAGKSTTAWPIRHQRVARHVQRVGRLVARHVAQHIAMIAAVGVVLAGVTFGIWKICFKPAPTESTSQGRTTSPLADKPSIAVLPFENMSKDPDQDFFSDGMTEEVVTTLARSPYLSVIARNSTYKYKGKPVEVKQVGEELGVRYVLGGSIRRSGERVRITAQLIDAKKGHHLWAEEFDREIKDIFTLQDEIASKIMKTLHVKLQAGSYPSETRGGSKNAEAYLKSMEANEQVDRFTREGIARSQRLFEEVIALEPDFSRGYSGLALSYGMGVMFGMSKPRNESLARAIGLAEKALSLNEKDAINHAALAYLLALTEQHDKAVVRAERALALDGNSFSILNFSGLALMYSCRGEAAIAALEKAERLNPSFRLSSLHLSWAYRLAGRYEEAFKQARKAVDRSPNYLLAQLALTATSSLSGREAEARGAASEVLRIIPEFSVERYRKDLYLLFKDKDRIDITINALRKVGLK